MKNTKKIIITAGGTGGHVFPAEALAQELLENKEYELFLITDKKGKRYKGALGQIKNFSIQSGPFAGGSVFGKIKTLAKMAIGLIQAYFIMKKIKADIVVGFGGYASLPAGVCAIFTKTPLVLHEQNAVLGKANRMLASKAIAIATSFKDTKLTPKNTKTTETGMPVRPKIKELYDKEVSFYDKNEPINIFIFGGSQGARVLSTKLPEVFAKLSKDLKERLNITQQCRKEDIENVKSFYEEQNIKANLKTFFDDIPEILGKSHLVISRSGASSVAEILTSKRPSILFPYPYAADKHQDANAAAVDDGGAGWLVFQNTIDVEKLSKRLSNLLNNPDTLKRASDCAKNIANPNASKNLAKLVKELIE
jgi:UDP-N-acetylglucosamine--N-acetylmuramyl-(pentapeptide) pyrophosphoryl-undecaprenol N-acetylglucosamine transferase